jgi:hypothetical protein
LSSSTARELFDFVRKEVTEGESHRFDLRSYPLETYGDALFGIFADSLGKDSVATEKLAVLKATTAVGPNGLYLKDYGGLSKFESTGLSAAIGILECVTGDKEAAELLLGGIKKNVPKLWNSLYSAGSNGLITEGYIADNAIVGILAVMLNDPKLATEQLKAIKATNMKDEKTGLYMEQDEYRGDDEEDAKGFYLRTDTSAVVGILEYLAGDESLAREQLMLIEKYSPKSSEDMYLSVGEDTKGTASANAAVGILLSLLY